MTVMVSKLTGGHLIEEDLDSGVASCIKHIHLSDMLHTNDFGLVTDVFLCFLQLTHKRMEPSSPRGSVSSWKHFLISGGTTSET